MYSHLFCIGRSICKLITQKNRVFIWEIPFLISIISIILLPCFFNPVFADDSELTINSKENTIMSNEATLEHIESAKTVIASVSKLRNGEAKRLNKAVNNNPLAVNSPNVQSNQSTDQSGNNDDWWSSEAGKKLIEIIQYFFLGALVSWPPMFYALRTPEET